VYRRREVSDVVKSNVVDVKEKEFSRENAIGVDPHLSVEKERTGRVSNALGTFQNNRP